jgi:hypothetical protein
MYECIMYSQPRWTFCTLRTKLNASQPIERAWARAHSQPASIKEKHAFPKPTRGVHLAVPVTNKKQWARIATSDFKLSLKSTGGWIWTFSLTCHAATCVSRCPVLTVSKHSNLYLPRCHTVFYLHHWYTSRYSSYRYKASETTNNSIHIFSSHWTQITLQYTRLGHTYVCVHIKYANNYYKLQSTILIYVLSQNPLQGTLHTNGQ